MGSNKADVILHPARLQILMTLGEKPMTTQDLADRLKGVPKSSIYRHIRVLLENGMVAVAETRPVKGTLEKFYRLEQAPVLSQADLNGFTPEDHRRYFSMYLASLLQDFSNYLEASPSPDFQLDRTGYSETSLHVSPAELERLLTSIRQVLSEAARNTPAGGRRRRHSQDRCSALAAGSADRAGTGAGTGRCRQNRTGTCRWRRRRSRCRRRRRGRARTAAYR